MCGATYERIVEVEDGESDEYQLDGASKSKSRTSESILKGISLPAGPELDLRLVFRRITLTSKAQRDFNENHITNPTPLDNSYMVRRSKASAFVPSPYNSHSDSDATLESGDESDKDGDHLAVDLTSLQKASKARPIRIRRYSNDATTNANLSDAVYTSDIGSSNGGQWGSNPASASYSCGETPPMRSGRSRAEKLAQHTQSASISPEETRNLRQTNASPASNFAANITRSFSAAISSSPPNRKRPSPIESLMNSVAPSAVAWGNNTVFGSVRGQGHGGRSSYSEDETVLDDALFDFSE